MGSPEGLVLVDKPAGITSHDVVDVVRRRLGTRKVGHAGTLDPMATGLMLIGVGRATRLLRYLSGLDKAYEGTARLGVRTDTLDADGEVLETRAVTSPRNDLAEAMARLTGDLMQVPPAYSAVKVGGRTMHEAARKGEVLPAQARPVCVRTFELSSYRPPDFEFTVSCSSGTYVRVLVSDVGDRLGCGAHLTRLVRSSVGPFLLEEAVPPDEVAEPRPVETVVRHLPRVDLIADEATAASHGRPLAPAGIGGPYGVYDPDGNLVGVYRDEHAKAVPEVILAPRST
jgi:tRNA pseudouridine55 synthase